MQRLDGLASNRVKRPALSIIHRCYRETMDRLRAGMRTIHSSGSCRTGSSNGTNHSVHLRCGTRMRGLVGARGFEPPTSCSQSRRATGLRYAPTARHLCMLGETRLTINRSIYTRMFRVMSRQCLPWTMCNTTRLSVFQRPTGEEARP